MSCNDICKQHTFDVDIKRMTLLTTFLVVSGFCLFMAQRMNFGHRSRYHQNPACPRGRYGPACDKQCSEDFHCKSACPHCISARCTADSRCQRMCLHGWWKECEERCSGGCLGGACDEKDGTCLHGCKPGLYGPRCSKHCSIYCTGKTCLRSGACECKRGYSGMKCTGVCPSKCTSCLQSGKICTSCEEGSYGIHCESKCGEGCLNTSCGHDGSCFCKDGYHGKACSHSCPFNCNTPVQGDPTSEVCDEGEGCLLGCRVGWFDKRCNKRCPNECSSRLCHQNRGDCLSCISGRFGPRCNISCDQCLHKTCNIHTGSCLNGCQDGFFGEMCNKVCSVKCLRKKCTDSPPTGIKCLTGCVDGWWGWGCERPCDGQCITCERSTGTCASCNGHHTGNSCKDPCGPGCLKGMCSMKGFCTEGCKDGFYGMNCSLRCGAQCKVCHREDGSCWSQPKGKESNGAQYAALTILVLVVLGLLFISSCTLMSSFRCKSRRARRMTHREHETLWRFLPTHPLPATEAMHNQDEHVYEEVD